MAIHNAICSRLTCLSDLNLPDKQPENCGSDYRPKQAIDDYFRMNVLRVLW